MTVRLLGRDEEGNPAYIDHEDRLCDQYGTPLNVAIDRTMRSIKPIDWEGLILGTSMKPEKPKCGCTAFSSCSEAHRQKFTK